MDCRPGKAKAPTNRQPNPKLLNLGDSPPWQSEAITRLLDGPQRRSKRRSPAK